MVHCDIKPENIETTFRWSVLSTLGSRSHVIVGTLAYASLNPHFGINALFFLLPSPSDIMLIIFVDLDPRDDLESLAFTLIFLLKGGPLWQAYSERKWTARA
jgi:serine/threonine protein kinase